MPANSSIARPPRSIALDNSTRLNKRQEMTTPPRKARKVQTLKTVAEIVTWLGGTARAARWAGYPHASGVSNWLAANDIPAAYHYRLHLMAEASGAKILPAAFGLDATGSVLRTTKTNGHAETARVPRSLVG